MILNKNIQKQFKKKGVLLVKNLFEVDYIKKIKSEVIKLKHNNKCHHYYEKSVINKKKILIRSENFYDKNLILKKLIDHELIKNKLKEIYNEDFVLFKEKINYKYPGTRKDLLHQDIQAGWDKFSKKIISALVCLEISNNDNAPLYFDISGHNKSKRIGKYFEPLSKKDLKKPKFKKFLLNPGDVIFFNSYVPHFSNENLSNNSRFQLYLSYNPKKEKNFRKKYLKDKMNSFPADNFKSKNKNLSQKYIYRV